MPSCFQTLRWARHPHRRGLQAVPEKQREEALLGLVRIQLVVGPSAAFTNTDERANLPSRCPYPCRTPCASETRLGRRNRNGSAEASCRRSSLAESSREWVRGYPIRSPRNG